jgi:hypothetical protein
MKSVEDFLKAVENDPTAKENLKFFFGIDIEELRESVNNS